MNLFTILIMLVTGMDYLDVPLGVPLTIDYSIPQDLVALPVQASEDFQVIGQSGDSVTIVPLALDTLELPPISALADSVEMQFPPPLVTVARTMPDTTWTVPVFTSPISMGIPPGFPSDYLRSHMFWLKWGKAPSRTWILILIAVLAVIATLILFLWLRRRRRAAGEHSQPERRADLSPLDEVRALLESSAFVNGRWQEYYKDVEMLLRNTVAFRFGVSNRALTWRQIGVQLGEDRKGRKFMEDSRDLMNEIVLQRYAGWGGSRERARRYTESLIEIRKEWHRR